MLCRVTSKPAVKRWPSEYVVNAMRDMSSSKSYGES